VGEHRREPGAGHACDGTDARDATAADDGAADICARSGRDARRCAHCRRPAAAVDAGPTGATAQAGSGSRTRRTLGTDTARDARRAPLAGGALNLGGPVLGLLSAISWGTGDFAGGLLSRVSSVFTAVLTSQIVGLAGSIVFVIISGEAVPVTDGVAWAALAGASGVIGLGAFYYALSRGTMGIVAPLTAVIGAGVPVLVSIVGGDLPDPLQALGMALALTAVVLISLPGGERTADERRRVRIDMAQLPVVLAAGLGFAGFFLFLDRATTSGETWWPVAVVRVVGVALSVGALLFAAGRTRGPSVRSRASHVLGLPRLRAAHVPALQFTLLLVVTGLGDLGGNAFFVLAAQTDALAVAVVLASLYPVVTTVLAGVFLHERLRPAQILGIVLATVSVLLLR
jgi:drug/metabolite transporter (DMT)-like permease